MKPTTANRSLVALGFGLLIIVTATQANANTAQKTATTPQVQNDQLFDHSANATDGITPSMAIAGYKLNYPAAKASVNGANQVLQKVNGPHHAINRAQVQVRPDNDSSAPTATTADANRAPDMSVAQEVPALSSDSASGTAAAMPDTSAAPDGGLATNTGAALVPNLNAMPLGR